MPRWARPLKAAAAGRISTTRSHQFDPVGRLRRALIDGRLFRTQGNGLAALTHGRNADETVLIRHDLDSAELEQFVGRMVERLRALHDAFASGRLQVTRQVPSDA